MSAVQDWAGNASLRPLLRPVADLAPHPRNPRRGDVESIRASLARFGQQRPILATPDGTIVAGNHTYRAALEEGWTEIAVVVSDLTDAEVDAYLVADNRLGDLGGYDDELLIDLLRGLRDDGGLAGTGYDDGYLRGLITAQAAAARREHVDEAPDVPSRAVSKPGERYDLGDHVLVCGDATDEGTYDLLLGDTLADLVWTDPPYGVDYVGKTADALKIRGDDTAGLHKLLVSSLAIAYDRSRPGANWYVAAPSGNLADVFGSVLTGLDVRRWTLVWVKQSAVLSRCDYHHRHEFIFYGWKRGGRRTRPTDRTLTTVLEFDRPSRSAEHPTMKPVALIEQAVQHSSRSGDTVLDPFGGSGSTMIACEQQDRACRMIELDPSYCDVIRRRYAEFVGRPDLAP